MRVLCNAILMFFAVVSSGPLELVTKDIYRRPFSLSEYRGRVVVLIFTNKKYVKQETPSFSELHTSYAMNQDLQSVVIFSSKGIPKIGRRDFREGLIEKVRKQKRKFLKQIKKEGKDPEKVIFPRYLTDWKLSIHEMFDMDPMEEKFSIAILDRQGILKGHFPGEEKYEEAIQLLDSLLESVMQVSQLMPHISLE